MLSVECQELLTKVHSTIDDQPSNEKFYNTMVEFLADAENQVEQGKQHVAQSKEK